MPNGQVHISTSQACWLWWLFLLDESGMYWKSQSMLQITRTDSHLCNRNCLQFIQDIDSHFRTKERAFITYHTVAWHFAEQSTNYQASERNSTLCYLIGDKAFSKLGIPEYLGLALIFQVPLEDGRWKDVYTASEKKEPLQLFVKRIVNYRLDSDGTNG